jgi:transposase
MSEESNTQEVREIFEAEKPEQIVTSEPPPDNLSLSEKDQEPEAILREENAINDTELIDEPGNETEPKIRLWAGPRKGRALARKENTPHIALTGAQRLLLLDTWRRSKLPAGDFAPLVGLTKNSLYVWKKRFEEDGPAGLADKPRGAKGGIRVPEVTRRSILMLKEDNPEWGCQRITDMLARGPGLGASAGAVARVLHEAGYELEEVRTKAHPDHMGSCQ